MSLWAGVPVRPCSGSIFSECCLCDRHWPGPGVQPRGRRGRTLPSQGPLCCREGTGRRARPSLGQCPAKVRAGKQPWQTGLPERQRPGRGCVSRAAWPRCPSPGVKPPAGMLGVRQRPLCILVVCHCWVAHHPRSRGASAADTAQSARPASRAAAPLGGSGSEVSGDLGTRSGRGRAAPR